MRPSPRAFCVLCACLAAGICELGKLAAQENVVIVGSGSYLPVRLYQAWVAEFNKRNHTIQVQYLPLGSSESLSQVSHGIGDFGSGEVPLTDAQLHSSKLSLIQIPTALVGIVPIYNLPGNPELNFSGELLGQIYLGTVKNWNDLRIAKMNPDLKLPDLPIRVVHRSPGKGSNYIFTDFLSKTNAQFRTRVGISPSPKWPLGVESDRSQDMVRKVEFTPGSIGYVEMSFLHGSQVGRGRVENAAARFVSATSARVQAACNAMESLPHDDLRLDITNAPGRDSYPITSFTWVYVPTEGPSARRQAL
jgi:phosphate transport system substrate-binding protein